MTGVARVLVVFRSGPHGSYRARDGLEFALAALAFEHEVAVLALGDGAALLVPGQDPRAIGRYEFSRQFLALRRHGLARCGVARSALDALGLAAPALLLAPEPLEPAAVAEWITAHDVVVAF